MLPDVRTSHLLDNSQLLSSHTLGLVIELDLVPQALEEVKYSLFTFHMVTSHFTLITSAYLVL